MGKKTAKKTWKLQVIVSYHEDIPQSVGLVEIPDTIFQSMAATAAFFLALAESEQSATLAKVSMAVEGAKTRTPKWFVREKGKLYFNPVGATLEAYNLRRADWDKLEGHVALRAKLLLNIE